MDAGETRSGTMLLGDEPEPFTVDSDITPARPWRVTLRRQFMPLPVAGLLWYAAEAAHAAPNTWPIGAPAATAVYFVAAVTWWTTWAKEHPATRAKRRRWATTVIGAGGAWLLWAATVGPGPIAALLLAGGGAALMAPHWNRNSPWQPHRYALPVEEELPEPPDVPTLDVFEARTTTQLFWDTVVVATVAELRGTYLCDPYITDTYEQYTIQLIAGTQTTGGAVVAAVKVASAFARGLDTISILPHPSGEQDKAVLRVAKANPLQATRYYPGPEQALDLRDGNIRCLIGYRGDGSPVWWTWYRAGWGALGGAVFGDTGSGKSTLLRSLITSAAYSGLIVPIIACPQGGQSYPMWIEHGHWPAPNAQEILRQGRALMQAHATRSVINRLRRRDIHVPTADEPMLVWFVDEFHKMADEPEGPEFYRIADTLEREGRKTAIRCAASDQDPSVPATFGNMMTLRRSLLAAQAVMLRMGSNVDSMVPGMKLNPTTLAKQFPDGTPTSGLGVLLGEAEPFRVATLHDAWALARNAPVGRIETATANRMGADYTERHVRNLADDADGAAELQEWDPELVAAIVADNPELAAALPQAQARRAAAVAAAKTPKPAAAPAAVVLNVPAVPQLKLIPIIEPTWTCLDRVRDLLTAGVNQFGELWHQARRPDGQKYSETAVRDALKTLISKGQARDAGYGRYEAIAA